MEKALEKGFELEGVGDILLDFAKLPRGEFFPSGADGRVIPETVEEELDFAEGEAHIGGKANQEYARKSVACVAALAAYTLGRSQEAAFFVVADRGGIEAGGAGELADFHDGALKCRLT
jgi:hypothetical protein